MRNYFLHSPWLHTTIYTTKTSASKTINGIIRYLCTGIQLNIINEYQISNSYTRNLFSQVKTTGFGPLETAADKLLMLLMDFINDNVVNTQNGFGIALGYRINTVWYGKPTVYNQLVRWCESQNL